MSFRKKAALVIAVIFVGLIIDDYIAVSNGPECSEMTFEQASKSVYDDYLERLERWEQDVKILGTRKPTLTFEKNEYQNKDTYLIPFTAQGPTGKTMLFAILTCKTGYIEYSEQ
ncbi:YebF family protein [Klebsiella sp. BIGb0407]|uniref:YebF family protein n=1 Tax=Klebsiella sp. BIGb0407 TaxID=2940603 RepID=UPI002167F847|nr:YebF family protein [Klebsiella sp. BIGb0407]MCS3433047.1 hypothetical protein [Klebsiella sp. BIGb0407]